MSNKLKLSFLHFCDFASFDKEGKINLLGVFDKIFTSKIPFTHRKMFVIVEFELDDKKGEDYSAKIKIQKDGVNILKDMPSFKIKKKKDGKESWGIFLRLFDIEFDKTGEYELEIIINDKSIKGGILHIEKKKE